MLKVAQIRLNRKDHEPDVEDILNGYSTSPTEDVPGLCSADAIVAISSHNVATFEDHVEPVLVVLYRA